MKKVIAECMTRQEEDVLLFILYSSPHLLTGRIPVSSGSEIMINLLCHDGSSQKD
ncbi:MAG: hypothetical protein V9819_01155 [Candidatus Dasytiphilus stammeri]